MGDDYPLEEEFIIDNVDALKMIADPLRLQIMRSLEKPRTVKDLAAQLDIPATKLYYHVNQLETHKIIRVVDTRIVSGIIEKALPGDGKKLSRQPHSAKRGKRISGAARSGALGYF